MNTASMQHHMDTPHETSEFPCGEERLPPAARVAIHRAVSNLYSLWRLCAKRACWRAGGCKGDPTECLDTLAPLLAPEVIEGGRCMFAAKAKGLSFEEFCERLPDEFLAFTHWRECIDRRPLPRAARDIPKASAAPNGRRETAPRRRSRKVPENRS